MNDLNATNFDIRLWTVTQYGWIRDFKVDGVTLRVILRPCDCSWESDFFITAIGEMEIEVAAYERRNNDTLSSAMNFDIVHEASEGLIRARKHLASKIQQLEQQKQDIEIKIESERARLVAKIEQLKQKKQEIKTIQEAEAVLVSTKH